MMLAPFLAVTLTATSIAPSGARLAITQSFIDGLRDAALPAALSFLENAKFNVSQLHGTIPGGKWWVTKIQQSNVGADAAVTLLAPNKVGIQLTNLKLNLYAGACGQELFLKACGSLTGDADGTSASAVVSVAVENGVPALATESCDSNIKINNLRLHGLAILDPIFDAFAGLFKTQVGHELSQAICGMIHALPAAVNPFLKNLTYVMPLSFLPVPQLRNAQLDWHLVEAPRVVKSGADAFLAVDVRGETTPTSGAHDPNATQVALPDPTPTTLRMVTTELSPYPFNTAIWTYFAQGVLSVNVSADALPPQARGLLNTRFFEYLMPKLYEAYPGRNMSLVVRADRASPELSIRGGKLTLSGHVDLGFVVLDGTRRVDAFHVRDDHFSTTLTLSASDNPPTVKGSIADIRLTLTAGRSAFGDLVPELLVLLSAPLNAVVNGVILPICNRHLNKGVVLPTIKADIGGYRLTVNLTRPEIDMSGGSYALVGTSATIRLVPPPPGQ